MVGPPDHNKVLGNVNELRSGEHGLKDKLTLVSDTTQEMAPGVRGADIAKIPGGKFIAGKAVGHYTGTGEVGAKATEMSIDMDSKIAGRADELRAGDGRPQLSSMDDDISKMGVGDDSLRQQPQIEPDQGHSLGR